MISVTLSALAQFPEQLVAFYAAVPADYACWTPPSWDGMPSEAFTPIEQICHVRDIEIDGYQVRFRRALGEANPQLASLDGYALAKARKYRQADADQVLAGFRAARAQTVAMLAALSPEDLERTATFEGYGAVSVRSLVHYLCSHDQQHLAGLQWLLGRIAVARDAAPLPPAEASA